MFYSSNKNLYFNFIIYNYDTIKKEKKKSITTAFYEGIPGAPIT